MSEYQPVPYMRLTSDSSSLAPRVKRGMTMDQVREIWRIRSEAKTKQTMAKYEKQRIGAPTGYGREKFGTYGQYQSRVAREKVRLAAKLLESAGLEVNDGTISKVTGQSKATIWSYWEPARMEPSTEPTNADF
jgi:hypothetical protein